MARFFGAEMDKVDVGIFMIVQGIIAMIFETNPFMAFFFGFSFFALLKRFWK